MANNLKINRLLRVTMTCVTMLWAGISSSEMLHVRVVDAEQNPVPDVAVFVKQSDSVDAMPDPGSAVMDQRDRRFEPHILIVQKGTEVEFPNSDVVAHHVYSFSKPNNFVLPLYKGSPPNPVRFDHEGVVTLGCNIHDSMLGYIVVVDTSIFALTNEDGVARLEVAPESDSWDVHAWSPRFRDSRDPLVNTIESGEALTTTFVLEKKLRPAHIDDTESTGWDDYD